MIQPARPPLTPEQEVLLWAIRVDHSSTERIAGILKTGIDWDYLLESAAGHGIIPLLYRRLKGEMGDLVPPAELANLRILFQENAVRNIRMTQHLLSVLDILADHGITAMPYKGPALSIQAYGDLSMRTYSDLDILIHAADVFHAYRILTENGYVLRYPGQINIERRFAFLDHKDLNFTYRGDILEVHWKVIEQLYAVPLDMAGIWDRARPVCMNGREIMTISAEDMVILLCFHGHKHGWKSLGWLADLVHTISNHPGLPWRDLLNSAETLGLKRIVLTSLYLAHHHGGADFGSEIENLFISDKKVQKLAREILRSIFQSEKLEIGRFLYLRSRERPADKIWFILYYFANRFLVFIRWIIRPFTKIQLSSQ